MLWLAVGCRTPTVDFFESCELDVVLDPASGAPGEVVTATGSPLTQPYDTLVSVGGVDAEVLEVAREPECEECDTCKLDAGCLVCGTCLGTSLDPDRRLECFGDPFDPQSTGYCGRCVETLTFVVPASAPRGLTTVVVLNRNGSSAPLEFRVGGTESTGDTSAETADTSTPTDTSAPSDTSDTAPLTTATADTAPVDTSIPTTADTASLGTGDTASDSPVAPTGATADTAVEAASATGHTGSTADTGP